VFSIPVAVFFILLLHKSPNLDLAWVPVAMALEWLALTGIALILAPVTVMMSDVERLVRIVTRMLFYLSPVLYRQSAILDNHRIPGVIKDVYTYNPFTAILSLYRGGFYRADMPSVEVALRGSLVSAALFVVGLWVFRKMEPAVLKEI
jgi:ABC-2 type transport system permease protein